MYKERYLLSTSVCNTCTKKNTCKFIVSEPNTAIINQCVYYTEETKEEIPSALGWRDNK